MNPFGAAWRFVVSASAGEFAFAPAQLQMRLFGYVPYTIAYSEITACGLRTTTADVVTRRRRVFGHKERVVISTRRGHFVFEPEDRARFVSELTRRCPTISLRELPDRSATVDLASPGGRRIEISTDAPKV